MHGSTADAPTGDRAASAGLDARFLRAAIFGVLLALLPARLAVPSTHHPFPFASTSALADDGEGDGGGDGGGEGDGGGDGEGEGGDGEGGDGGGDGESESGDDGSESGDHGSTGSSISGFLSALVGHGKVESAFAGSDSISVTYSDGWTEQVSSSRYQLLDRRNRVVVSRKARPFDIKRLRAAAGL